MNAADLEIAFGVKSVQQDMHSAQALELLHTEKIALEQLNEQLDSQMTTLDANMDSLKDRLLSVIYSRIRFEKICIHMHLI